MFWNKDSMLYWWELVKDLPVPKPKTKILRLDEETVMKFFRFPNELSKEEKKEFLKKVEEIIEQLKKFARELGGYPVFLRTDYTSGKFIPLKEPLYMIKSEDDFRKIWNLICECHEPADVHFLLPPKPNALILREWLNIEKWTNVIERYNTIEVRAFIKDGDVVEIYPYYHFEELLQHLPRRLDIIELEKLKKDYEQYVKVIERDLQQIAKYSLIIARKVEGYWSVDFAKAGKWYFIDMATGKLSWRPEKMDEYDKRLNRKLKKLEGNLLV